MTFSEKEVRLFVKLKQSLWFDRYKLVVSLVLLFLSIVLHVFGNQFELVFSIIAFLILIEACLSKKSQAVVALYEKALSSDANGIKLLSKATKPLSFR